MLGYAELTGSYQASQTSRGDCAADACPSFISPGDVTTCAAPHAAVSISENINAEDATNRLKAHAANNITPTCASAESLVDEGTKPSSPLTTSPSSFERGTVATFVCSDWDLPSYSELVEFPYPSITTPPPPYSPMPPPETGFHYTPVDTCPDVFALIPSALDGKCRSYSPCYVDARPVLAGLAIAA